MRGDLLVTATAAGDRLGQARAETAISLSFHILFAVLGVGLPWLLVIAEDRAIRRDDPVWRALAHRWAKALAVLFAIGAVSGTVLSFEFGLLWPAFLSTYGGALALPFTLEGFAFFAEAIFLGLYLYGWERLRPRAHWATGVAVAVAGTASTLFIVTANAWMNVPTGVHERDGKVVSAEPFAPLTGPAAAPQALHMLIAAIMCTGGAVAGVYAVGMLRGRRDTYHRRGLALGLAAVLTAAPLQVVVGDWAARVVETNQPVKLAAMEGLGHTRAHAPLTIGGIYDPDTGELQYGLKIPSGLSLLTHLDPGAKLQGLDVAAPEDRPRTNLVHTAFDVMVGLGMALLTLAALVAGVLLRRWRASRAGRAGHRGLPEGRWWLRAYALTGVAAYGALLAGWMVTELGRQPWIVYGRMRVADAVTTTGNLTVPLVTTIVVYVGLAVALVAILRRMATGGPAEPPTETGPADPPPAGGRPDADQQNADQQGSGTLAGAR